MPGKVCDLAMREWLSQDHPPPGQMQELVPEIFERMTAPATEEEIKEAQRPIRWKDASDRQEVLDFCLEVVRDLEPILDRLVLPYRWTAEQRWDAPISIPGLDEKPASINMMGYCDIIVVNERNEFSVYDLKVTRDHKYLAHTLGQATFYDIGVGYWVGDSTQPKRVAFIAPATREPIQWVAVEPEHRRAMMARIIRMAHALWMEDYRPKEDDKGCSVCEVRHACDKFSVVKDVDAVGRNVADLTRTSFFRSQVELEDKSLRADTQ